MQALCAICQQPIEAGQAAMTCPDCAAIYHDDCWQYNGGCGVYGCPQSPPTDPLTSLEVPASFWGKEEKQCPACQATILAAAVRCRHCGATFASAQPQEAETFFQSKALQQKLPAVRKWGIWLLVLSLLTCTAPFAAVLGAFWYSRNRQAIRALPAMWGAICKISLGLAVGQTVFVIVVIVIHSLASGG